jgi:hypothetical protein
MYVVGQAPQTLPRGRALLMRRGIPDAALVVTMNPCPFMMGWAR